jgi:hypothetical protein
LLERARKAKEGPKFKKLFDHGDTSGYPSPSEADFGLIRQLIYWTNGDQERITRLFKMSALYREKYSSYVERSVRSGLARYTGSFYRPRDVKKARRDSEASGEIDDPISPYLEPLFNPSLWYGREGTSAYKTYAAAVVLAEECGIVDDSGQLRIGSDVRRLAEVGGIAHQTVCNTGLPLLSKMGLVRWRKGKGTKAGTLVLPHPRTVRYLTTKVIHTAQRGGEHFSGQIRHTPEHALQTLRLLIRMRRGYSKSAQLMRLGMVPMFITVSLFAAPHRVHTAEELRQRTGRRGPDVRRACQKLKAAGIVREISQDVYRLTDDFAARYALELERSGITYAERNQRRRHAEDRRARAAELEELEKKRKRGERGVSKQTSPARGKEGIGPRLGGADPRAARRKAREKVRESKDELLPNAALWRERKEELQKRYGGRWFGTRAGEGGDRPDPDGREGSVPDRPHRSHRQCKQREE